MLYLIAASLLWSFSFGIIKSSLAALDPGFVGWARLLLSAAVFAPLVGREALGDRRLAARLVAIGAVQYGLMYSLYLAAYAHLAAHQIALFTVFTPIYVVLWDGLRRRQLSPVALGCAALAIAGAALLRDPAGVRGDLLVGFALVQGANLCFAAGQIEYRRLRRARPELRDRRLHGLLLVGGLAVTAATTTLRGGWGSFAALDHRALAALAYLGVVASGLGFFLWNAGAVRTQPATLAVLNNLKIPLGVAVALLVFGEATDLPRLIAGGGVMLLAALVAERWGEPAAADDGEPPAQET
ncbi:MAG: EamA family transporter [Myxococcales bacterium]|nr:EamA family transporter [Myxococcales bacterium]